MRSHKEVYCIKANKETIFNVIATIEKYPTFLPWCVGSRIVEKKFISDIIKQRAEMVVVFKSFRENFFSNVNLDKHNWTINISSYDKPFKYLEGSWIIKECDDNCEVSFEIEFEFKSYILDKVIGIFFFNAVKSIVKAFEDECLRQKDLIL